MSPATRSRSRASRFRPTRPSPATSSPSRPRARSTTSSTCVLSSPPLSDRAESEALTRRLRPPAGGDVRRRDCQAGPHQAPHQALRRLRRAVRPSHDPRDFLLPVLTLALRSDNANATLSCPIEPGSYTITQSVDLPAEIPRGALRPPLVVDRSVRELTLPCPSARSQVPGPGARLHPAGAPGGLHGPLECVPFPQQ